jgi:Ca2+-binding RTX toxin-like protein
LGTSGNDLLTGDGYDNTILGYAGNDVLNGGLGSDTITGGADNDTFVFSSALSEANNIDEITDFSRWDDTIQLENNVVFATYHPGPWLAAPSTSVLQRMMPPTTSFTTR